MVRMLASTRLTDEQREYVEIVQRSAMGMLSLLDDIQDFARMGTGELELESVEFDLWEVLVDAMRTVSSRAHEKKLDLCYDVADDVPAHVIGDPNRLRQVLVNMLATR
jgi:signal transduction histidine kinase